MPSTSVVVKLNLSPALVVVTVVVCVVGSVVEGLVVVVVEGLVVEALVVVVVGLVVKTMNRFRGPWYCRKRFRAVRWSSQ